MSMLIHTYPHKYMGMVNWLPAITKLTAHVPCSLMSDLVISKNISDYGQFGHTWY